MTYYYSILIPINQNVIHDYANPLYVCMCISTYIAKLRKVHSRGSKLENCRILNGKNPCCCLPEIDSALEFEKSAMSLFVCVCLEIIMKMIFFFVLSDENFLSLILFLFLVGFFGATNRINIFLFCV